MDTQRLKDKILQLAIQGKLVEQDKNDEPASELLQRIKEERDKLIKEKKIRKPKKLPPIEEDEKPFEIPEGWEWVRLGEVGLTQTGTTPSTKQERYYGGSIPFIKPNDIYLNKINYDTQLKLTEEGANKGRLADKYSILMVCIGTIGKVYVTDKVCSFNQQINSLSPYMNKITHSKNLLYFMQSKYFQEKLWELSSSTTIPILNKSKWESILIPLPPLAEQKRIVEKVDELFALIDELDSNKEDLLEVINLTRNQVLQEAIQGKLVEQNPEDEPASVLIQRIKEERDKLVKEKKIRKPKKLPPIEEEEKPFEIPEGWEWVRLGEVTIINPRNSFEDNKEVSFVPMALIDEGFRNNHTSEVRLWKDIKRGFTHFAENDVAIAKITPCFENRKSAIMRNLVNEIGAGTTELHIIRSVNALILPEYILNICKTDRFIKEGVATYTGTAGQQRISKDYITNLTIPLPPLAEQKRIVEKVDMIMDMLDELENELITKM